jgi:hypothetical protein
MKTYSCSVLGHASPAQKTNCHMIILLALACQSLTQHDAKGRRHYKTEGLLLCATTPKFLFSAGQQRQHQWSTQAAYMSGWAA